MEKLLVILLAFTSVILRVKAYCSEGAIRLAGSSSIYQGRVEVCHYNTWGTVCDDGWSNNDGRVACQQLGFRFVRVTHGANFGRGYGQIWLDDLSCSGTESRLVNCYHRGFGINNCDHYEDAGVVCAAASSSYNHNSNNNDDDDNSDGSFVGVIAGISVGAAFFCIIIIIVLMACSISVWCYYVKRPSGTCDVPTTNVIPNESLPPTSTQPPVTVVSYAMNCDSAATPYPAAIASSQMCKIPSMQQPPNYAPKNVHTGKPAAQHVVH